MIRLSALNADSSEEKEEKIIHPKEAVQEEELIKLYNEGLQEQKKGNNDKAEEIYRELLSSSLLAKIETNPAEAKVKKPNVISSIYSKPTVMLKYSCLKNLAVMSMKKNLFNEALDYYTQALDIDGTDVSVWYQAGSIAMKISYINIACDFFLQGLECSPKHWPCLDKLIICLFTLGNYIACLEYINKAFILDSHYTRGHVLRDYILTEQPSLKDDIVHFFQHINLHMNEKSEEREEIKYKLLKEAITVRSDYHDKCKSQRNSELTKKDSVDLCKKIETASWVNLGECILETHEYLIAQDTTVSFLSPINLKQNFIEKEIPIGEIQNENVQDQEMNENCATKETTEEHVNTKEQNDEVNDKKNKKNRGSALMEELLWGGKRRSARVRSSLRGNPEPMDVAEALRRILPRKLLHKTKSKSETGADGKSVLEEDSMDTMDLYRLFERQESAEERLQKEEEERCKVEHDIDKIVEKEGYFGRSQEFSDVKAFIESHDGKNIIEILQGFVTSLETHWRKTWPNLLPILYIKSYQLVRKYNPINFSMCSTKSDFLALVSEAGSVLLYGELCVDYLNSINKNNDETGKNNDSDENNKIKENKLDANLSILFIQNIVELVDRGNFFESEEHYFEFLVRLYWLRCHIFLSRGQTNLAIASLNEILAYYELYPKFETKILPLKNCRKNRIISKALVEEYLADQSRKRSLAEVVRLYEDESYKELTEILKETFSTTPDLSNYLKSKRDNELVDRQTQLSMLVNGLYHLGEFKECIYWLETCCYEIMHKIPLYGNESGDWMVGLDRFLLTMEDCLALGELNINEALPANRLSRFVQTLCHAICKELEDSDRPPCPARPWIMLHKILAGMEKEKEKEKREGTPSEDEDDDENDIPSSILILFTAHEYLRRREWCNCNDSVLLFLILDQVVPQIRNPDWAPFRETIQQHLEQVVFCLYTHPNKKPKVRYLTDHNVTPIPLTWSRGMQLFELFRPDETPSYDSLRINLISSDTEVLFRRIAALIPDENDPVQNSEKMLDFIVGKRNDVPQATVKLPPPVKDLFYILGDYYFKTHEFAKAVNYLLIDLCANPDRVDSWASMALSRASVLEQQLNSCDPIKNEVFLQDALAALRCYEHCLQLDGALCTLWIEYGTFVYSIHSFCSQRLKLESDSLSLEQFEELETTKNKMLDKAKQAFVNANLIWYEDKEEDEKQDERWLHHYMLGKISEKHGDLSYFEHYEKAAELLYENDAEYPNKISYNTPPTLSIEALEIYYRIHVCVIKNLELNEGKPLDSKTRMLFNKYLDFCANGPFAKQVSKGDLAKVKTKEAEVTVQNEKQNKIIQDLLTDLITKIEKQELEEKAKETEEILIIEEKPKEETDVEMKDEAEEITVLKNKTDEEIILVEQEKPEEPMKIVSEAEKPITSEIKKPITPRPKTPVQDLDALAGFVPMDYHAVFPYQQDPFQQDSYYLTLEDFKNNMPKPKKIKKKRRSSRRSVSSSSSASADEVKYDDDSDSSSSGSESSSSSSNSSSTSSETSESIKAAAEAQELENKEKVEEKNTEIVAEKEEIKEGPKVDEKMEVVEEEPIKEEETEGNLLKRCLHALEICALRFPQHYKSVYRLAHFYFRSKGYRDLEKCRQLLLGRYQAGNGVLTGLFAERKNTNFFNGIWRIPAADVDRAGSFASHMSRSVLLLMEALRDLKDHKMLLELSLQLSKVPEPDKKYLREDERNQLSVQAFNLSIKTLRKNVKESAVMTLPIVLDTFRCYKKVQKHYSHRESIYGDILLEAFKRLGKGDKCTLEQAIRFCQSEISGAKIKTPRALNPNATPVIPKPPKPPKIKNPEKKEKKKATLKSQTTAPKSNSAPKPQVTAKAVPKIPKQKKVTEKKKQFNLLQSNLLADASVWSSLMQSMSKDQANKPSTSTAQNYTELLKNAAQSSKSQDDNQTALKSMFEKLNMDYNQQCSQQFNQLFIEQMKYMSNPALYQYANYPLDYNTELYKRYNAIYNSTLMTNFFSQFQNPTKKQKAKVPKPANYIPKAKAESTNSNPKSKTETTNVNPKPKAEITNLNPKPKPETAVSNPKPKPETAVLNPKPKPEMTNPNLKQRPEQVNLNPKFKSDFKPVTIPSRSELKPVPVISRSELKPITVQSRPELKPVPVTSRPEPKPITTLTKAELKSVPMPVLMPKPKPLKRIEIEKPEEKKTKTNFNIDDILGKPSKAPQMSLDSQCLNVLTPSQLNLSIEDKIKNAFSDLDSSAEQTEAINLSPIRKKVPEQSKRTSSEIHLDNNMAKKVCRQQEVPSDNIEVVVIDD